MSQQSIREESPLPYLPHRLRQHELCQVSTTETSETNLLKVGREVDLLQIIATIEQALGQFLQMVRQGELLQRTFLVDDISEDARPQGLYAIWKRGDRDGITLSESIAADVLQCRGKLGEFEFSAITKSPLAYRL